MTSIDVSLAEDGTEKSHERDRARVQVRGHFRLYKNPESNECALVNKIDAVFGHKFKDLDSILHSSAYACDVECKSSTAVERGGCNSHSEALQS